jgi:hypothetical protein
LQYDYLDCNHEYLILEGANLCQEVVGLGISYQHGIWFDSLCSLAWEQVLVPCQQLPFIWSLVFGSQLSQSALLCMGHWFDIGLDVLFDVIFALWKVGPCVRSVRSWHNCHDV